MGEVWRGASEDLKNEAKKNEIGRKRIKNRANGSFLLVGLFMHEPRKQRKHLNSEAKFSLAFLVPSPGVAGSRRKRDLFSVSYHMSRICVGLSP